MIRPSYNVLPLSGYDAWAHPNSVFTYNVNAGAFSTPLQHEAPASNPESINLNADEITINQGDHVLICHAGIPNTSGHKLSDEATYANAFPSATNKIHLSAHEAKLGAGSSHYIHAQYNNGFESRAKIAYFDRENFLGRVALSTQDGTSPYGPPTFAGIQNMVTLGNDAGIGTLTISDLYNHNWEEAGPIHIIRWASGNAPPLSVIETAIEWVWYEWSLKDNFIVYPPLINY